MTNHWTDIGNSSLVFAIGCNPAENHPACMAHINSARFDIHYDDLGNPVSFGRKARLIVVDPRRTRTAQQTEANPTDLYVRIRPGTDIAFINGVMKYIFDDFMGATHYNATAAANFIAFHNGTAGPYAGPPAGTYSTSAARTFIDDGGVTRTLSASELAAVPGFGSNRGWPKYTDARVRIHENPTANNEAVSISGSTYTLKHLAVKSGTVTVTDNPFTTTYTMGVDYTVNYMSGVITRVNPAMAANVLVTYSYKADDYTRGTMTTASGWNFSNMLVMADVLNPGAGDPTVFEKLRAHIAPYDLGTVQDICGCSQANIVSVAQAFIDNSRFADGNFAASLAANGIDVTRADYRSTTLLYAMGGTQHTCGSQNIRDYAVLQSMMGNMGRPGGGINALRGIHNVQGSTDMGVLYDSIPAYSGNPGTSQSYSDYSNKLFGNRMIGGTADTKASKKVDCTAVNSDLTFTAKLAGSLGNAITVQYVDPALASQTLSIGVVGNAITVNLATDASSVITTTAADVMAAVNADASAKLLVAVTLAEAAGTGLVNAVGPVSLAGGIDAGTNYSYTPGKLGLQQRGFYNMTREWFGDTTVSASADIDSLYALWPKGNGYDHITAFRNMGPAIGTIKAAVVWGQNPAVTEPNQSAVRDGLKNLDTLVCVDMFPNETVECERKNGGVTYFIPACSHVEEAGSVTNSGRWLQWRERATTPKGNSKADLELMLRFAKALNAAGAFSHIKAQWAGMSSVASLYAAGVGADPWTVLYAKYGWDGVAAFDGVTGTDQDGNSLTGSEYVADKVFWEIARPLDLASGGGTMWIYSGVGNAAGYTTTAGKIDTQPAVGAAWTVSNRAKSRNNTFQGNARNFPRWGFAWLLNRRVMYNNGEVQNEVADNFVAPGLMARMFTINSNTLADWSLVYRAYNTLNDLPSTELAVGTPHVAGGRFPAHTEPSETPRDGSDGKANLLGRFGRNTSKGANLYKTDGLSPMGTRATYPLILTTIRCVEHFQGGPITRNNSWNVEAEPVPWIELNSIDARNAGIVDGDWVNVITARSNSTTDQEAHTPGFTGWARGFKARVGSGIQSQQRVAPGVVAIPWHWGDKGLAQGSRANDLTMDSWDANTIIPEYKACLCRIVKL